jgi:hypothetical protein
MHKPRVVARVVAPSCGVGKIRGIAYGMRGILLVETVIIYNVMFCELNKL